MAKYIEGQDRNQMVLFPEKLDDLIAADSEVRIIDSFVETLDLQKMGFQRATPNQKGTNSFNPKDLLKLYLYGYRNKIRSSRKLEALCRINIEVKWLMKGLEPDFRTISDFRKENIHALKEVFEETVAISKELKLLGTLFSEDGYKVEAVNSKERNYTLKKLEDRMEREKKKLVREIIKQKNPLETQTKKDLETEVKEEVENYFNGMEEEERKEYGQETIQFTKEMVEIAERVNRHQKLKKELEETGESQKSLTDPEARLMKNNGKYEVCYNVQEMTDAKSHIVVNYEADNTPADSGKLEKLSKEAKRMSGKQIIDNITDKGYNDRKDMARCLENGIRPHVTLAEGEEYYELEFEYEEQEVKESEKRSRRVSKIRKCLRAGEIPDVYKSILKDIRVEEKKEVIELEDVEAQEEIEEEDLRSMAMEHHCFVRNKKQNKVFCPQGETLYQKSTNAGRLKYWNREACKRCKNPCTQAAYKEAMMKPDQVVSTLGNRSKERTLKKKYNPQKKKETRIKKVVKVKLIPEKKKLKQRMGTSEHVHGTLKRTDDASYLLLKGKEKVNGELALSYCAINLRRLLHLIPFETLMRYLEEKRRGKWEKIGQKMKKILKKGKICIFFAKFFFTKKFIFLLTDKLGGGVYL